MRSELVKQTYYRRAGSVYTVINSNFIFVLTMMTSFATAVQPLTLMYDLSYIHLHLYYYRFVSKWKRAFLLMETRYQTFITLILQVLARNIFFARFFHTIALTT